MVKKKKYNVVDYLLADTIEVEISPNGVIVPKGYRRGKGINITPHTFYGGTGFEDLIINLLISLAGGIGSGILLMKKEKLKQLIKKYLYKKGYSKTKITIYELLLPKLIKGELKEWHQIGGKKAIEILLLLLKKCKTSKKNITKNELIKICESEKESLDILIKLLKKNKITIDLELASSVYCSLSHQMTISFRPDSK